MSGLPWLRQALLHAGLWLLAAALFVLGNAWLQSGGGSLAASVAAVVLGFLTVNLTHEWGHFLGARLAAGRYTVRTRPALFVFDWDFAANSVRQFYIMSLAGTIGGLLGVALLLLVAAPGGGGAQLLAGGLASFAFGSLIEWPVLLRVGASQDPLGELSKITPAVLLVSAAGSAIVLALVLVLL